MNGPIDINVSTDCPLTEQEIKELVESRLYTLFMPDFLKMPDMDFGDVALKDPEIKALFN